MINVAVVTPVFNLEKYLSRCIKSILSQKNVSLQYFIVDDGSTDGSVSIAQIFQKIDPRIIFIRKFNEGQGVARNIGIKLADAEYIYFMDGDDYLGDGALFKMYTAAKENDLDICSPRVPIGYFDRPLEYVSCLPTRSQFFKLSLIRKFELFQPTARSGQDGVFSHLFLTHCSKIGMVEDAEFHYTHQREGSTFASYLKRHEEVYTLLENHYRTIEAHYNKFNLWKSNSMRLLQFVIDESLKNRLLPHFQYLSREQRHSCINLLSNCVRKAYSFIRDSDRCNIHPALIDLATRDLSELELIFEKNYSANDFEIKHINNDNKKNKMTLICMESTQYIGMQKKAIDLVSEINNPFDIYINEPNKSLPIIKAIDKKLDLVLNTINNVSIQLSSATRSPAPTCNSGEDDLIVSLTTIPSRLNSVHFAIESIFLQTVRPAKICLWLTEKVDLQKCIPPELEALKFRGLEIRQVEDIGPHTKLIYALKEFPDKSIVTIDDDFVYPIHMLQCLIEQHRKFPNAVVCNWARELSFDGSGLIKGVRSGKLLTPPVHERELEQLEKYQASPNFFAFPYGASGVLYPPGSLHETVFDVPLFKELCPSEDDIWFKAMALLNKTPVVITNLGINPIHHSITGSQVEALRYINHGFGHNQNQMISVFNYFNLHKNLLNQLMVESEYL